MLREMALWRLWMASNAAPEPHTAMDQPHSVGEMEVWKRVSQTPAPLVIRVYE